MTTGPKISLIINSYNYERYIAQAIESAIAQDYPNREIIVVDDGSTDGSRDIIRSFGTQIVPIFNENLGQARTCLRAIRRMSGQFVQFLDSDDYLLPGALTAIAEVATPDVAKIQFQLLPVGPAGETVGKAWPAMPAASRRDFIRSIERTGTYVTPPNSGNVYRADVFDYIADIDYESSIDGIPYLLAPLLGEVRQIDRPLGCYRYHDVNFSGHGTLKATRFALEARRHQARLDHLAAIVRENGLSPIAIADPRNHSFVHTRRILEAISDGKRPGLSLLARYSASLLREGEPPRRVLPLLLWGLATGVAPDRMRSRLALYRSDPRSRRSSRRLSSPA